MAVPMSLEQFEASLNDPEPPAGLDSALRALWHEGKDDWDAAHRLAQEQDDRDGAWVHAYLHRVEGDLGNAGYWYRRAGRTMPGVPVREEWAAIVGEMLARR